MSNHPCSATKLARSCAEEAPGFLHSSHDAENLQPALLSQHRISRLRIVSLVAGLPVLILLLAACRAPLVPPAPTPTPFQWSVADMLAEGATGQFDTTTPGFYCASCGSDACRQRCIQSGAAVGMQNRFLLCELMRAPNVYNLGPIRGWVEANAAAGLRSIIGFNPKTDRGYNAPARGSCTPDSDGSPAWMLQPGSAYQPLRNGTGAETTYHLNYRSPAVQSQLRGLMQALRQEFAAMPPSLLATVDSIELNIGHDGEMDPTRNYDNFPVGAPLGWMDLNMYRCVYAGYTWNPARNQQFCTDSTGAVVNTAQAFGAASVWRDAVAKPVVDIYGQELSLAAHPAPLGKPIALLAVGQILTTDERATPCTGCGDRNIVDYAFETYGIGVKTTGVNPDLGNGNGPDILNLEYRNWPNIFKLTWPARLTVGEHGVNIIGSGHCCDDPKELYWAVLNALDKHMSQLHFLAADIGQAGTGAAEARALFIRYAGKTLEDTPDVWIVLRDTAGTYFPDGDNGASSGNPPGRVPCCRFLPNFEWFIYQRNPSPGQVVRSGLPVSHKSLSARSNASAPLQLDVEDAWPGAGQRPQAAGGCAVYDVEIEYLNSGNDAFRLRYARFNGSEATTEVRKTGTGQWRSTTLRLNDAYLNNGLASGADLELVNPDGVADIFHRVRVELVSDCTPPPPTPAPTATPTVATATPTFTATATPSATATPTSSPTPTATVTPSATPTTTQPGACLPALLTTIALPADDRPKGMAADADRVYVALHQQPRLAVIDAATDQVQTLQPLAPGGVNGVAVVDGRVYTSNRNSAQLSISQAGSGTLLGAVGVGSLPWGVGGAVDRVFVANFASGTVSVVNTATGAVLRTTAVGAMPAFVAALPNQAYVSHISGRLSILSRNGTLLANLNPGSAGQLWGLALSPGGERLYLADRPGNRILVMATATNQVVDTIALPGPPTALALNPGTGHLFAVDSTTDRVYVVATRSGHAYLGAVAVGSQDAGEGGQGIAVARNKVYVANWQGRSVTVLDDAVCPGQTTPPPPTPTPTATPTVATATPTFTATATPSATATPTSSPTPTPTPTATPTTTAQPGACLPALLTTIALPADDRPKGMAADADRVYVALHQQPRLAVIDAATDQVQTLQPLAPGGVNGVAVVDGRVYTSNRNSAQLSISQAGSGTLLGAVGVGSLPWGVGGAVDRVFVANFASGTVSVVNTATGAVLRTTAVASMPAFVAALPNQAYVSHISGRLSILSRNGTLLADLNPGSAGQLWGLALSPGGERLYLADRPGNRILVMSTSTNQVVDTIALPGPPTALALNPGTGHLFAVDSTTDRVYVVATRSGHAYLGAVAVGSQDAGEGGQGIAVARNKVYVANWQGRSVTVLDDAVCPGQTTPPPPTPTPTPTPFPR